MLYIQVDAHLNRDAKMGWLFRPRGCSKSIFQGATCGPLHEACLHQPSCMMRCSRLEHVPCRMEVYVFRAWCRDLVSRP